MSEHLDESGEHRLNQVLTEYLQRTDRGEFVDQEALIAKHPEMAGELREFFSMDFNIGTVTELPRGESPETEVGYAANQDTHPSSVKGGGAPVKPVLPPKFGRYEVKEYLGGRNGGCLSGL